MPWTTKDQLTPNPNPKKNTEKERLTNGSGSVEQYGALYYFEDIAKVINQQGFQNAKLTQLNVKFELNDGHNQTRSGIPVHEITVIAAVIKDDTVLANVALPWAPYYDPEPPSGTENFPGNENYFAGRKLEK